MIYKFPTANKRCKLVLNIYSNQPRQIFIVGFDETKRDTEYFKRIMPVEQGVNTYEFNLPLSPPKLTVIIFDLATGFQKKPSTYKVVKFYQTKLPKLNFHYDDKTKEFIKLNNYVSKKAGHLKANMVYHDPKRYFKMIYYPKIEGGFTPARIHKTENYIEISQDSFRKLTVPNRWLINAHEYSHNYINRDRDNEDQADANGMELYLMQGFPYIEGFYTFERILHDTESNEERKEFVYNFLMKHRLENWQGAELW